MLTPRSFREAIEARGEPGMVVVFFLASFKPISEFFGIPGVERAGRHVSELTATRAAPEAIVASLSWLSTGVFLPAAGPSEVATFITALTSEVESDDLEIKPGEWAEVRLAVGRAEFKPGANAAEVLEAAANLAEKDEARFPEEWHYPVLIADD